MKLLDIPLGLAINPHVLKLIRGVLRLILPGANLEGVCGGDGGNKDLPLCYLCSLMFTENAGILRIPEGNGGTRSVRPPLRLKTVFFSVSLSINHAS